MHMKESFEDKMTNRIKEVMDQYEPEYAPQDWENFKTMLPVREFWIRTLFMKYRYWFAGTAIFGLVVIVSYVLTTNTSLEYPANLPGLSGKEIYFEVESPAKINSNVKPANNGQNKSFTNINGTEYHGIGSGKDSLQTEVPATSVPPEDVEYKPNAESDDSQVMIYERTDQLPFTSELPDGTLDVIKRTDPELVQIEYPANSLNILNESRRGTSSKSKLQWPEFNILSKGEKSYGKFIGPNQTALFYSPEIHSDRTLGTTGISHGLGFMFSGPVRPAISISAGLSYQANNFSKTVFSEKVLPPGLEQPFDSVDQSLMIDSTGISSGNYGFLELPLSISFRLMENDKSGFWISAGMSSIAFLKQEYTFETIVGDVSNKVSTSVKAWKDIYLFGSINAGLSYRYKFSSRLSLHSAVIYKQHLGTMGYNSMKLNRLNLQIGLIYRFGREYK